MWENRTILWKTYATPSLTISAVLEQVIMIVSVKINEISEFHHTSNLIEMFWIMTLFSVTQCSLAEFLSVSVMGATRKVLHVKVLPTSSGLFSKRCYNFQSDHEHIVITNWFLEMFVSLQSDQTVICTTKWHAPSSNAAKRHVQALLFLAQVHHVSCPGDSR